MDRALKAIGGAAPLAEALGITTQAISQWKLRDRVPVHRVLDVERLTGVHRHLLNPETYPDPPSRAA